MGECFKEMELVCGRENTIWEEKRAIDALVTSHQADGLVMVEQACTKQSLPGQVSNPSGTVIWFCASKKH
jgi:hypothetical protein